MEREGLKSILFCSKVATTIRNFISSVAILQISLPLKSLKSFYCDFANKAEGYSTCLHSGHPSGFKFYHKSAPYFNLLITLMENKLVSILQISSNPVPKLSILCKPFLMRVDNHSTNIDNLLLL